MEAKSGPTGKEMTMEQKLISLKKDSHYKDHKIWVTGHSLGGAMAKLFGRYLLDMTRKSG